MSIEGSSSYRLSTFWRVLLFSLDILLVLSPFSKLYSFFLVQVYLAEVRNRNALESGLYVVFFFFVSDYLLFLFTD